MLCIPSPEKGRVHEFAKRRDMDSSSNIRDEQVSPVNQTEEVSSLPFKDGYTPRSFTTHTLNVRKDNVGRTTVESILSQKS